MLKIHVPPKEIFNAKTDSFESTRELFLEFEHSLYSMSLWETTWKKPFLKTKMDRDELVDYIRCMSLKELTDIELKVLISDPAFLDRMIKYIGDSATATVFSGGKPTGPSKTFTTEEFYYLMAVNGIPFECDKWNFNRLATLLRICAIRSAPQKKMSKRESAARRKALNEQRRKQYGSSG